MKISIKAARVNAEMSAKEVAEKIGVGEDTIYNYEKGKIIPRLPTLQKLAEMYGCEITDFREVSGD